jgi:hypothetical protein
MQEQATNLHFWKINTLNISLAATEVLCHLSTKKIYKMFQTLHLL